MNFKVARRESLVQSTQEKLELATSEAFATIHDSVVQYSKRMLREMKRHNYVTPTNYLELVSGYKRSVTNSNLKKLLENVHAGL